MSGRRPSAVKRLAFSLAPLLGAALFIESIAWVVDREVGFRRGVLESYGLMAVDNRPLAAQERPRHRRLKIRPLSDPGESEPLVLGGRVIEGAAPTTRVEAVEPEDVVDPTERRVLVVGGSAAFGFPYPAEQGFAHLLEARLGPSHRVLNAARAGRASGAMVPVALTGVDFYELEALVIYSGNNEWIRWSPPGRQRVAAGRLAVLGVALSSRALSAVVLASLEIPWFRRPRAGVFAVHAELSGLEQAFRHPARDFDAEAWRASKVEYLRVFEDNLLRMTRYAQERGVRVLLLTVPFNYRLAPAWKHPQPLATSAAGVLAAQQARARFEAGDAAGAVELARAALRRDADSAVLHYLHAAGLERLGRYVEAEEAYAQSREHMVGNLGSRLSINRRIRAVAAQTGATLVDLKALFDREQHRRGGFFNDDLIHDDCHPTPLAHRLIAERVAAELLSATAEPYARRGTRGALE